MKKIKTSLLSLQSKIICHSREGGNLESLLDPRVRGDDTKCQIASTSIWTCLAMTVFFFCVVSGSLFAEEDFYLEGVSYESERPAESIAVINGVLLKESDQFEGYRITEVKSNFVRLAKLDGSGERLLHVTGGAPKLAAQPNANETATPSGLDTSDTGKVLEQDMKEMMAETITKSISALAHAKSAAGLADLRQIYTAVNIHFAEYGDSKSITFDELVKSGMLSPAFKGGTKGDYRFTIKGVKEGVTVNADPVNQNSGLRHFFMDENGDVYSETSQSATSLSTRHKPQLPF